MSKIIRLSVVSHCDPETVDYILGVNNKNFNYMKTIEEMSELSEVLVKCVTKEKEFRPPKDKIIEECGDLFFRLEVLAQHVGVEKIIERIDFKNKQLKGCTGSSIKKRKL